MIKAYFISDLHIGAHHGHDEPDKQNRVLTFLKTISNDATHLYIVGDLFDFWFEYRYVIPKEYFPFLFEFRRLADKGIELHYLAGNHDFALSDFFDREIGMQTWPETYVFELGGKRFYLFHGDGVAKKDVGYRMLKRILRNKWNQRIFRFLHPDVGIPFARKISGSSRKYTNQMNHLRDEGDYIEFAETQFDKGVDFVLMGHRHNPLVHEREGKKYINLGDWITHNSYAVFNGKELELSYFQ
jgi:UDP-2,3-diacylglucosamine hydrolase